MGGGGGVVAKSVFQNLFFFFGLKSSFIVRFINVKKCWFYLFAQHSSSKKSTCPHIRFWKKLNFGCFFTHSMKYFSIFYKGISQLFFLFFSTICHTCVKCFFWKKIEFSTTYKHFEKSFFFMHSDTYRFLQNRQYYRKVRNNKKTHFEKPQILKYFYQNQFVRIVRETVFLFSDVMKMTP